MTTYSLAAARRDLDAILDEAASTGGAEVCREDGRTFVIRPAASPPAAGRSPLDVPGVAADLTAAEIVAIVREGRERSATD